MSLSDWQFQLGSLVMGPGTVYSITSVEGLDMAAVVTDDLPLLGGGVFAGRDRFGPRQVLMSFDILDVAGATFAASFGAFVDAWQQTSTDADLTWKVAGITNPRKVTGRPRRLAYKVDFGFAACGHALAVAEFFCPTSTIKDATTSAVVRY